jgi:hypothetical protein
MNNQSISLKRSELYEKVWSTPKIKLAKEFGISDVALGKICKRNNIPKPGLGYWAKLEYGKPVKKIPLPSSEDGDYEIVITAFEKPEIRTVDSDPEQVSEADQLMRRIQMDEDPVEIPELLDNAHKEVLRSQKSLKNAPKNESDILTPRVQKCLPIHVSRKQLYRALIIMETLLTLLDKYGLSLNRENLKSVNVLGHSIAFALYEKCDRQERPLTKKEEREKELYSWHKDPKYVYVPNGKLNLIIEDQNAPTGLRTQWSDGIKQTVENHLKKFILTAIEISVHKETLERRSKRQEQERQRQRAIEAEISSKRWDEQRRVEALEKEIEEWSKSQKIRAYIAYIHDLAIKRHGAIEAGSDLDKWI